MATLIVLRVLKEGYDPEALPHQLGTCQARKLKAVWLYHRDLFRQMPFILSHQTPEHGLEPILLQRLASGSRADFLNSNFLAEQVWERFHRRD